MVNETHYRKANYDIDSIYLERWSPRAFLNKEVPEDVLNSLFEAARWAPSAANKQPWRYIIARTTKDREKFLTFINNGNVIWCDQAPVLVAVLSYKMWNEDDDTINPAHAFDAGTSWGYLALEAARKGLIAHAMGGFNRTKAKETLNIPEDYDIHAIIAIGYEGSKSNLPEELQEREKPSDRKKIQQFIMEGSFTE